MTKRKGIFNRVGSYLKKGPKGGMGGSVNYPIMSISQIRAQKQLTAEKLRRSRSAGRDFKKINTQKLTLGKAEAKSRMAKNKAYQQYYEERRANIGKSGW